MAHSWANARNRPSRQRLSSFDLEELSDAEIEAFRRKYARLAEDARQEIRQAQADTGSPQIEFPS